MDALFEARAFFRHLVRSRGPHGIHSPFIYRLITEVLTSRLEDDRLQKLEAFRRRALADTSVLEVPDFGAGSRVLKESRRQVRAIARTSLSSPREARALHRIARDRQPRTILELGTSLGITTAYLASAAPHARIITIEGAPEIGRKAQAFWKEVGVEHIDGRIGSFVDQLPHAISDLGTVDLAIVDGHHLEEPTIDYIRQILPHLTDNGVLVADDIHWSPGMERAWDTVKRLPGVGVSADFFDFGVLWKMDRLQQEHFILRRPKD